MSRPLRMGAAAAVVAGSVLFSRLLGLARETLLASLIGVNVEGDLYRQAFTIPDFLNYLLAGAYLTITLIPILSRHLEQGDDEGANRAFSSVFRFVALGHRRAHGRDVGGGGSLGVADVPGGGRP